MCGSDTVVAMCGVVRCAEVWLVVVWCVKVFFGGI